MNVEAFRFSAPIKFDDSGNMYVELDKVNISLSSNYILTISDGGCTKTISLRPPTEEEKDSKRGRRSGTSLCSRCQWK
ncbi:unnamed protein product [Schistosoma haematobium]|nr:unnamed protein product [Schistosoma haematobium]